MTPHASATKFIDTNLGAIQETSLITLWARLREQTRRAPAFADPTAQRVAQALSLTPTRYRRAWGTQLGVRLRTLEFDRRTEEFLRQSPLGTVVEVGVGFNSRFERVHPAQGAWYDVDVADVVSVREQLFKNDQQRQLWCGSILEEAWLDQLADASRPPWLFLLEGVLMYFPPDVKERFLRRVAARFPGAQIFFDALGPLALRHQHRHDLYHEIHAPFQSCWDERWERRLCGETQSGPALHLLEAMNLAEILDRYRNQLPWGTRFAVRSVIRSWRPFRSSYWYVMLKAGADG